MCGQPGSAFGEHDEGVEEVPAVFGGGGEVAADRAELLGSGEGAQAAGYLLPQLDHSYVALGAVVVGWYSPVGGEAEVVVLAVAQPAGERVVLAHQLVGAGGGGGDADLDGRAVELELGVQGSGVEGAGTAGDRAGDELLYREECVAGLGGPAPAGVRPGGLSDRGQLPQGVSTAELVFGIGVAVVGRPRVVHRHPAKPSQHTGRVDAPTA